MDDGLAHELAFWRDHCAKNDLSSYLDPERRVEPSLEEVISHIESAQPGVIQALDIGCGPLTVLGNIWSGGRLEVTGIDPLAYRYSELLLGLGIERPFASLSGYAEELDQHFPEERFDLVFSHNALDHCRDPAAVIRQALRVCRSGGALHFVVFPNEGEHARYSGLHQWNFDLHGNAVVIWNRCGSTRLDEILEGVPYTARLRRIDWPDYPFQIETIIYKSNTT
jgi:SAM-dependent methyltransferase